MREPRPGTAARRGTRALALGVLCAFVTPALAQFSVRAEITVATEAAIASRNRLDRTNVGLDLRGHVEAAWDLGGPTLRATLDPVARVDDAGARAARFEPGVTEALLSIPADAAELRIGLLQQPVQTARLSVPFRIEAMNAVGMPEGVLGAAGTIYLDTWRLRPAALYRTRDGAWGGGISVRRDFRDFDLETHLYRLDRVALGLGGSGLVGDTVLYGEAWLLSDPWVGRGAAGASGFAGAALWTLEAAYAPLGSGGASAVPQFLGRIDAPLDGGAGIAIDAGVGYAGTAGMSGPDLNARGSVRLYRADPDSTASIAASVDHGALSTRYALRVSLTVYR
jgi:hypothetical protein